MDHAYTGPGIWEGDVGMDRRSKLVKPHHLSITRAHIAAQWASKHLQV